MPRLHKLRRRQKFHYNVNRRLLNKKREKLPRIQCDAIRNAWDDRKSLNENLTSMGLIADTNSHASFHIPSGKQQMMPSKRKSGARTSDTPAPVDLEQGKQTMPSTRKSGATTPDTPSPKSAVVADLEQESSERFKAKKAIAHPLPKEIVKRLTGFLDKYGEDYEAMSRDYGNYNQETPAQLRSQVNRLKKVPQQWIPYLKRRGILPPSSSPSDEGAQDGAADMEILPC